MNGMTLLARSRAPPRSFLFIWGLGDLMLACELQRRATSHTHTHTHTHTYGVWARCCCGMGPGQSCRKHTVVTGMLHESDRQRCYSAATTASTSCRYSVGRWPPYVPARSAVQSAVWLRRRSRGRSGSGRRATAGKGPTSPHGWLAGGYR
ncbi:hypothetical protein BZA05DRAFT_176307 [Tricharina praecox]|uniref:uncharacterized protein n=1 Tax=Tricharina praecox TaxID=43433 RepID=UPI00221F3BCE|nr:uncharacterized protein BZA05DRAFT_176307 [Tricharina praecox]KAI5844129.1 hypothetical protein BZA05DRAFT_176307 [Tricharina praecox]